jgi:hypothetical protein
VQLEYPWALGPPDGRYVLRHPATADRAAGDATDVPGEPSHVLVLATLGAPQRRRLSGRRGRAVEPEPDPAPVATGRATVIDAVRVSQAEAESWLKSAGDGQLETAVAQLNRTISAHRLSTADPYVREVDITHALALRAGFGAGEEVAEGRWTAARALVRASAGKTRRSAALRPQERLTALLSGRSQRLACEELILRTRLDLEQGRDREAALQLQIALNAAIAELPTSLAERVEELRSRQEGVESAAQAALSGPLSDDHHEVVAQTLTRLEAALRARAAAGG